MDESTVSEWFRPIIVSGETTRITALRAAARSVAESDASFESLAGLVLLSFGQQDTQAEGILSEHVQRQDETFLANCSELETQLAAAVSCAHRLESDDATLVANLVLSAEWSNLSSRAATILIAKARSALVERSVGVRRRITPSIPLIPRELQGLTDEFADDTNPTVHSEFIQVIDTLAAGLHTYTAAVAESLDEAATQARLRDEELDILWWSFAGVSELARLKWSAIKDASVAAILSAYELAAKIHGDTVPMSVDALIASNLGRRTDVKVSVRTAVEGASSYEVVLDSGPGSQLLPILTSIAEYRAMDGKPGWIDSVSRWNIMVDVDHIATAMARQFLRELAIRKSIEAWGSE